MTDSEIAAQLDAEKRAMTSLLAFRERFIPSKDDVQPAPFHEEWSDILLNWTGHFAVEAFHTAMLRRLLKCSFTRRTQTRPLTGRLWTE